MEAPWPKSEALAAERADELFYELLEGSLPNERDVLSLLRRAKETFDELPTLMRVQVPRDAKMHVVGDLHGQFAELVRVLSLCGMPEHKKNYFVFNGDFVDRGRRSVEVMLLLLALAVAHPFVLLLNRGNHESMAMNRRYGFEAEVLEKYSQEVFEAFQEAFCRLPLATVVNGTVLVIHGGLFGKEGVKLRDIDSIERKHWDFRGGLAMEALWSDPSNDPGCRPSPRGAGVLFGPDVAQRFCEDNGLQLCIRSHEVVMEGYEWQEGGHCLTVFSAANYGGSYGNKGAVCHLSPSETEPALLNVEISTYGGRRSRL